MSDADGSDKSQPATPEKRRKAREEGQFPRSKDAGAVAATAGVLLVLSMGGAAMVEQVTEFTSWCFRSPDALVQELHQEVLTAAVGLFTALVLPPTLFATVAAVGIGFAQAGWHPSLDLAMPKWSRVDPMGRLKSMFSLGSGGGEAVMSFARVGIVGAVTYYAIKQALPDLLDLGDAELRGASMHVVGFISKVTIRATIALAAIAAADYIYSLIKLNKDLMMSTQELKDEFKQQEGDPAVKGRIRQRMREMAKRAITVQVARADVIVTNPTHIAVALRYRQEESAPVVTAKGVDEVAMHIRRIAREAGIPIVENKPLARALSAKVKSGQPVPVELYEAVAAVLAFVYRLRQRMGYRTTTPSERR